ncbi:hypothetical protein BDFB_013417 [Asbolus verrucosus]|uniref:Uncharacterized protein n=1 Tax=Asbolus verrucosus TaxID=1661398 RepID=A0A482WEE1_ASBVE|nr:hypothetical protein BDFB_013417 [Asbolus verrucosus]
MFTKMGSRRREKNRNKSKRFGLNGTMPDVPEDFFAIANGLEHEPTANQDGTTHLYRHRFTLATITGFIAPTQA